MVAEARHAFETEDYGQAIRLYTKLLGLAEGKDKQQSLEMLGVSREFNGQLAHARNYYKTYLQEYPGTSGAERVQQRLAALLALEQPQKKQLKQLVRRNPDSWRINSHFSQFYQRHSLTVDNNSSVPINGLFNDFNLMAFKDGNSLNQEARITMSYLADFTDEDRLKGRELQISSAYWEGFSDRLNSGIKIGRQSRLGSGVPGRFDGAAYTYRITSNLGVDLTGGFLVDSSFDSPDSNRPFVGVSGEYVSNSGNVTIEPFFMQQYIDGILDRRAIGAQVQLFSKRAMIYTLLDYDLYHSALNNLTVTGNFRFRGSQISGSIQHRKSPYLTTRNALIGQQFEDLSEMEKAILDLQLEDIASDRTATSNTIRLGFNTRLSEQWTITADVVATDFSNTESSANVIALESNQTLYSSFQLRSTDIFGHASYSALMLRHTNSDSASTTSLYFDNRFSLGDYWRIYPRIRIDQRTFERNGDEQLSIRPTLRIEYRRSSRFRFQIEAGYQKTTREMISRDLDISGLFVRVGYRASF